MGRGRHGARRRRTYARREHDIATRRPPRVLAVDDEWAPGQPGDPVDDDWPPPEPDDRDPLAGFCLCHDAPVCPDAMPEAAWVQDW